MRSGAALANAVNALVTGSTVSSSTQQVALRFSASGGGAQIDDVFIDLRMK